MARCPSCDCPAVVPLWLGTYGDMVTLLLTFFILLLSMVTFDAKKLTEAEGSMKGSMSLLSGGIKIEPDNTRIQQQADITSDPETAEEVHLIESEVLDFQENVKVSLGPSNVKEDGREGFVLRFSGKLLFKPNEYEIILADDEQFLRRLAQVLAKMPAHLHIDIIGHTDSSEFEPSAKIKTQEALSAQRAASVARILINQGLNPNRLTTLGAGSSSPLVPNINEENKARNRRVEFRFYPLDRHLHKISNILERKIERESGSVSQPAIKDDNSSRVYPSNSDGAQYFESEPGVSEKSEVREINAPQDTKNIESSKPINSQTDSIESENKNSPQDSIQNAAPNAAFKSTPIESSAPNPATSPTQEQIAPNNLDSMNFNQNNSIGADSALMPANNNNTNQDSLIESENTQNLTPTDSNDNALQMLKERALRLQNEVQNLKRESI